MALAASLRLDFVDDKGKKSSTKLRLPIGFTIAQYQEFAIAAAQILLNASRGAITNVSLTFNVPIGGLGLSAVAGAVSKVARKLFLQFSTPFAGFFGKTLFPTLDEGKVIAGSGDVDQTDVDVAALISALEDGIVVTGNTLEFTNGRGHDLVVGQTATEQFRRRSSG